MARKLNNLNDQLEFNN